MQFRIREIREEAPPIALEGTVSLPDFAKGNVNVESLSDVTASLVAEMAAKVCRVEGTLSADVVYRCARCLTTFHADLRPKFDESFTESQEKVDEDTHRVQSEWVVLDEFVAEAMQLAVEYRPLCKADCKGLCPECGHDLNQGECGCARDVVDPRLEALRDLLSANDSE